MTKVIEKENISYESLLAGALIRFGKVDENDMTILIDEFYAMYGIDISKGYVFSQYFNCDKGVYSVTGDTELERLDSKVKLGEVQGNKVKSFIGCINPEVLALRKVELLCGVKKDSVQGFNFEEFVAISKAMNENYLTIIWNDDVPHNDYEEIVITQRGRVRLFMLDYCSEIEEFRKLLDESGYDSNLIYDFLMSQDLSLGVYEILNLDSFIDYCNVYDRNRYASKRISEGKNKGVGYKKVPKDKK